MGQIFMYLDQHTDFLRLRNKQLRYFMRFDPRKRCTVQGILSDYEPNSLEHYNFVPRAFAEEVKEELSAFLSTMRDGYDHQPSTGAASNPASVESSGVVPATVVPVGGETFQQKIDVMSLESWLAKGSLVDEERHTARSERVRQQLIVCASLVDKIPNLGGLARTCEIFNVGQLLLGDMKITQDKSFQGVAVTADKWLPMAEVKPTDVASYLGSMRKRGFTILALEQASNSVSLASYKFPEKAVLLLGKEQEGVPAELLNLVDQCIEIPQWGLIRSLNVHVSASIVIWEFTQQQLCGQK